MCARVRLEARAHLGTVAGLGSSRMAEAPERTAEERIGEAREGLTLLADYL